MLSAKTATSNLTFLSFIGLVSFQYKIVLVNYLEPKLYAMPEFLAF